MTLFCIGRNYIDHAKELNNPIPQNPIVFCKPATAILRDNKAFFIPEFSQNIHYEVELLLRVGKNGKKISESKAMEFVSHIGLGIDFTARDLQDQCKAKGHPWEISKSFDHSAVVGEWMEIGNLSKDAVVFSLLKNKEIVQQGNSMDMIFNFNQLISHISQYFTLMQGDIIFTGTPAGVGPVMSGDLLEGFIGARRMFWTEIK